MFFFSSSPDCRPTSTVIVVEVHEDTKIEGAASGGASGGTSGEGAEAGYRSGATSLDPMSLESAAKVRRYDTSTILYHCISMYSTYICDKYVINEYNARDLTRYVSCGLI